MQPSELLDLIRQALSLTSDYQVEKKLGFSQGCVSGWRRNVSFPKNAVLIQFAKILNMNAGILMIYGLEYREKDTEAKEQIGKLINAIHHAKFDDSFVNSHA
ncbi:hypothetical protein [Shewanella violacea]|uniref:hypothetical protein n=1 Tax=Shewanella violacea TaxID=60217 RepID=UPI00059E01AC|nr:hypothetical protein [Shewanella violacea]